MEHTINHAQTPPKQKIYLWALRLEENHGLEQEFVNDDHSINDRGLKFDLYSGFVDTELWNRLLPFAW